MFTMRQVRLVACIFLATVAVCAAFSVISPTRTHQVVVSSSHNHITTPYQPKKASSLFGTCHNNHNHECDHSKHTKRGILRLFRKRLETLESADISDARVAGPLSRVKKLYNPITFLALALVAGFRWDWCFRNPYYWFGVGFCIKWYRARYVFKIPVWDRQPNWNNIITSKEQEKDLKAFTCKQCGSTLFIAKTREFFFEGNTGIGGLGCFTCGAKGKENFVMDRDRIVEDVADMDDYFEYERPLDFVSRAERRKILKEAQGDEEEANRLLLEKQASEASGGEVIDVIGTESSSTEEESSAEETKVETPVVEQESSTSTEIPNGSQEAETTLNGSPAEAETDAMASPKSKSTPKIVDETSKAVEPKPKKKKSTPKSPPPPSKPLVSDDDIFDALEMD